jgi:hypothetical protein
MGYGLGLQARGARHQVELPAALVVGTSCLLADAVAKALASCTPRQNTARRDGEFFIRYALADPADAETFHARFGGPRLPSRAVFL